MLNFNLSDLEDEEYQSESSQVIRLREKEAKREIINQVNPTKKLENDDQKKEPTIPKIDPVLMKKEERVDPSEMKTLEEQTEIQREVINPYFQVTDADLKDLSSAAEEIEGKIQKDIPAEQQEPEPIEMDYQQHSDNQTFHTQTQYDNMAPILTIQEPKISIMESQNFSDEFPFDLPIMNTESKRQSKQEKRFVLYNPKQSILFSVLVGEKIKFKSQNEEQYRHKFDNESSFYSGHEDLPRVETDVNNLSSIIIKSVKQQLQKKEKRVSRPKLPFQLMDLPQIHKSNNKRVRKFSGSSDDSQLPQIEQRLIGQIKQVFGKKIEDEKIMYFVKQSTSKNRKLKPQWLIASDLYTYQDTIDEFEEKLDRYTYHIAKVSHNLQVCKEQLKKYRISSNGLEQISSYDRNDLVKMKPVIQELLDCSKIKILTPSMEVIAAMMMKSGVKDLSDFESEKKKSKSKKQRTIQEETKIVEPLKSGSSKKQSEMRKQIFEGTYKRKQNSKQQIEIEGKLVQSLKEDILRSQKPKARRKDGKNQTKFLEAIQQQDQEEPPEEVEIKVLDADLIYQNLDKKLLEKLKARSKEFVILNHFQYDGSGLLVQIQEKNQNYICPARDLLEFKAVRLANYLKDKYIQRYSPETNL